MTVMNNFALEKQGISTYLVYKVQMEEELDRISMRMLTDNEIKGLIPTYVLHVDGRDMLRYNISGKVSVAEYLSGTMDRKKIFCIFRGIINALISVDEYMIKPNELVMDCQYIFVDPATYETTVLCLPIKKEEPAATDIQMFLKNILFQARFNQNEKNDYIAAIISYLNDDTLFSPKDFLGLLNRLSGERQSAPNNTDSAQSSRKNHEEKSKKTESESIYPPASPGTQTGKQGQSTVEEAPEMSLLYLLRNYSKENKEIYQEQHRKKDNGKKEKAAKPPKEKKKKKNRKEQKFLIPGEEMLSVESITSKDEIQSVIPSEDLPKIDNKPMEVEDNDFGATVDFSEMQTSLLTTVMLNGGDSGIPYNPRLINVSTGESIPISKDLFIVGRNKNEVDFFTGINSAISGKHCIIKLVGENAFIEDTSTNGTYLNDGRIAKGVDTRLPHDTRVRLADEEYIFKVY